MGRERAVPKVGPISFPAWDWGPFVSENIFFTFPFFLGRGLRSREYFHCIACMYFGVVRFHFFKKMGNKILGKILHCISESMIQDLLMGSEKVHYGEKSLHINNIFKS